MKPIHQFCKENGILCIPVEIVINNDGKKFPTNLKSVLKNYKRIWSPNNSTPFYKWDAKMIKQHVKFLRDNNALKDCNSVIVILYDTDFVMIDTDDESSERYIQNKTTDLKIPTTASLRGKGFHRYIKLKEGGNYNKQIKIGGTELDFITEYVFESLEKDLINHKEVCELSNVELENIMGYDFKLERKDLTTELVEIKDNNTIKDNKYVKLKDVVRENFLNKDEIIQEDILLELLNGLNPNEFTTNNMWFKIICALHSQATSTEQSFLYLSKFNEFMIKNEKFKTEWFSENNKTWTDLDRKNNHKIKSGTLWYWLKTQNIDTFTKLKHKRRGLIDPPTFNRIKDYEKQKDIWEEQNCMIKGPKAIYSQFDCITNEYIMRSKDDLIGNYNTLKSIIDSKNDKGEIVKKSVGFVAMWINDPDKREYDRLDFLPPPHYCGKYTFNKFKGFAVDDYENEDFNKLTQEERIEVIEPILRHIWFLCGEEQGAYDYMVDIVAHKIQFPGVLQSVNLVLRSEQGCGKNAFLDFLGNKIYGPDYYMCSANVQDFVGRFADGIDSKLLVVFNEMDGGAGYAHSARLKEFATEKVIKQEQKFQSPRSIKNFSQIWYASNRSVPVKIEVGDRRFVVFNCSTKPLYIHNYFEDLFKVLEHQLTAKCFHWYCMNKITIDKNYNFKLHRPITKAYIEMRNVNKCKIIRFCEWYKYKKLDSKNEPQQQSYNLDKDLEDDPFEEVGEAKFTKNKLWEMFGDYAQEYNDDTARKWNHSQFVRKLMKYSYDIKDECEDHIVNDIYKVLARKKDGKGNRYLQFDRNKLLEMIEKVNDDSAFVGDDE